MMGTVRTMMAVVAGGLGLLMAPSAEAAPIVTVTTPTVHVAASAAPLVVVRTPRKVWVPGYVRYDAYGNAVHVAGHWSTKVVTTRRVVPATTVRRVTTTRRGSRTVTVRR